MKQEQIDRLIEGIESIAEGLQKVTHGGKQPMGLEALTMVIGGDPANDDIVTDKLQEITNELSDISSELSNISGFLKDLSEYVKIQTDIFLNKR